jgi:hypothetical protein
MLFQIATGKKMAKAVYARHKFESTAPIVGGPIKITCVWVCVIMFLGNVQKKLKNFKVFYAKTEIESQGIQHGRGMQIATR